MCGGLDQPFFPIVAGTSAEKEGDGRQVVTPTIVPEPPTFNLLSEVASQLRATTLTQYVLQGKIEIRSKLSQPNTVDSQFPLSPSPNPNYP